MASAKKYALVDLHLHLDGSISLKSARALAAMQGIALDLSDEELSQRLKVGKNCRDLNEYLEKFAFPLSLLQTKEAISESVYRLCEELLAAGLIYAEIRFAPQLHTSKGLTLDAVVRSAIEGIGRSRFPASLILCCMRGKNNLKENLETVDVARSFLDRGVVALDLAGAEALYPTSDFTAVFEYARSLDIPFTIHAGEADGPLSVYKAIELGARRIGHGVRSVEDAVLLRLLAKRKIPLELCPTSNLNTCVFERIEDYPIRALLDCGVPITVNTDNLTVSDTTLALELQALTDVFGLTQSELLYLTRNAINATFLNDAFKSELLFELEARLRG